MSSRIISNVIFFCVTILSAVYSLHATAILKIDINSGKSDPMPIAIGEFECENWDSTVICKDVVEVISNNLEGCGLFKIVDRAAFLDHLSMRSTPKFANWRKINAVAIVAGRVQSNDGHIIVQFVMWDPYAETSKLAKGYKVPRASWRRIAHKISDDIYSKITGEDGYFDTRVLFVSQTGKGKSAVRRLAIMDQDGANFRTLTDGKELVLTPRFDLKSQRAIYMAYKGKVPHVYILDIEKGWQRLVGNFSGMSFAPRFSPDGNSAIMSVAKDGATNIYEIDLNIGIAVKLTHDIGAINTSPSYSPDGKYIVFNSDRAGSRQLYVMNRDGSDIRRISCGDGGYATPVWSPRGDFIAFTKIYQGKFYIGVMRTDGSGERLLTTSWLDEGPTWAPNGRVIMFTREKKDGTSSLYAVDITGYNERMIRTPTIASDPAWSPLLSLSRKR